MDYQIQSTGVIMREMFGFKFGGLHESPPDEGEAPVECRMCPSQCPDLIFDDDWMCRDCLLEMYREDLENYMMDLGGVPEDELGICAWGVQANDRDEFTHFLCSYIAEEHHITLEALNMHRIKYASNNDVRLKESEE